MKIQTKHYDMQEITWKRLLPTPGDAQKKRLLPTERHATNAMTREKKSDDDDVAVSCSLTSGLSCKAFRTDDAKVCATGSTSCGQIHTRRTRPSYSDSLQRSDWNSRSIWPWWWLLVVVVVVVHRLAMLFDLRIAALFPRIIL